MEGRLQRKTFLQAVAGSALATINFFYPGLVRGAAASGAEPTALPAGAGAKEVIRVEGPDPGFAGGEVVSKTTDGVVLRSELGVRAVRIPSETVVWKEFDVTADAIDVGDWVDVRGTPLADGTLQARSGWIWVNIGRRDGVLERVSPTALKLKSERGDSQGIELSPRLEVIDPEDGLPLPGQVRALRPGMHVGAVGLVLPNGGFRATRVWRYPAQS
jgi:hypothetical protein